MSKKSFEPNWTDYKNASLSDLAIDATNPNNISKKVLSERETFKRLLSHARIVGCEKDMMILYSKYTKLFNNCTNEKEKKDISKLLSVEIYRLLGGGGELYVDEQLVCKDN